MRLSTNFRRFRFGFCSAALLCGAFLCSNIAQADQITKTDPAFDRYVNIDQLSQAWADKNAPVLADIGLQLAEGERVLFRSHASVTADQVLAMALKVAAEKKDVQTITRLSKAFDTLKKTDLAKEATVARQLAGASRAADPALGVSVETLPGNAFLLFRDTLDAIVSAKIAGDGETLDIIIELTPTMTLLPEAQRKFIVKTAAEARASLPPDGQADPASQALNKLLEGTRDGANRGNPKLDSTLLWITYTPSSKGLRVNGFMEGGPHAMGKGLKLAKGDLILRVGNRASYGDVSNLDALITAAITTGNTDVLIYQAKSRKVLTVTLPDSIK